MLTDQSKHISVLPSQSQQTTFWNQQLFPRCSPVVCFLYLLTPQSFRFCLNLSHLKTQLENYYSKYVSSYVKNLLFVNYLPAAPCFPLINSFHTCKLYELIFFSSKKEQSRSANFNANPMQRTYSLPQNCYQKLIRYKRKFPSN